MESVQKKWTDPKIWWLQIGFSLNTTCSLYFWLKIFDGHLCLGATYLILCLTSGLPHSWIFQIKQVGLIFLQTCCGLSLLPCFHLWSYPDLGALIFLSHCLVAPPQQSQPWFSHPHWCLSSESPQQLITVTLNLTSYMLSCYSMWFSWFYSYIKSFWMEK